MPIAYPFACQKARIVFFASLLLLAACGQKPKQQTGEMKVPVSVVTVQPTRTSILTDLPGRVEAIKDAQIVARVTGIVTKVNFTQGSDVKQGQLLFTIDPAPYRAARDQAEAQLQQTQANVRSANLLAQRYAKLIKENAVSRQDYDNAQAAAAQAVATVAAARAALESADINLGYTKVVSPIDGRAGKSLVTEGALVSATAATQMADVQQIGLVYVDFTRSTTELAALRKALASGNLEQAGPNAAKVEVVLEDGSPFEHAGKLLFSGITVDPTTGQVNLRAEVPNPDHILLPGMYVRVRIEQGVDQKALLVPQQALQRTADGLSSLYVVKDGKAALIAVQVGPRVGGKSVINHGLKAGDAVVVEGFQKIRPGASVQAMPWQEGQPAASAKTPSAKPATKG
ncbi:MAG: efflux RND transporter periplasmic adaptor subunit [Paralcaligenes sp.]